MGRLIITRSQLGRGTGWFLSHNHRHHPPPPSSTTITSFIKHCSSSSSENKKKTLQQHIVRLTCSSTAESGSCVVFLVGTCHISEVVFLELCRKRQALLTTKHLKELTVEEIFAMIKKNTNILGVLISLMYRLIATELKIIPGSEFRVAYEEAMKYGGRVVLGDRPIEVTLTRAWRKMPFSEKRRLFSLNSMKDESSSIKDLPFTEDCSSLTDILMKLCKASDEIDTDMITQKMSKISPTLVETFLDERDQFMSSAILQVAKKSRCVVAVVGKGHLEGIKKHWQQPISMKDLLSVPPPPEPIMSAKTLISVGVFMAGVAMIWRCI